MAENVTSAKATAKMVRVSSRKVRLVLDTIRNKSVAEALLFWFTQNGAASDVEKVLKSAVANAENNNFDLDRHPWLQRSLANKTNLKVAVPSTPRF